MRNGRCLQRCCRRPRRLVARRPGRCATSSMRSARCCVAACPGACCRPVFRRARRSIAGSPPAAPTLCLRRSRLRRCRLHCRARRRRDMHRHRDRAQAARPEGLGAASQALGGGTMLRLARPQLTPRQRLRGHHRLGHRLPLRRLRHPPHTPNRSFRLSAESDFQTRSDGTATILEQKFNNRFGGFVQPARGRAQRAQSSRTAATSGVSPGAVGCGDAGRATATRPPAPPGSSPAATSVSE